MSEPTTLDDLAVMYATYRELTQVDCALVRAFAHWLTLPGGPEVVERARVAAGAGDPPSGPWHVAQTKIGEPLGPTWQVGKFRVAPGAGAQSAILESICELASEVEALAVRDALNGVATGAARSTSHVQLKVVCQHCQRVTHAGWLDELCGAASPAAAPPQEEP